MTSGWRIEIVGEGAKINTTGIKTLYTEFLETVAEDLWDYFEQSTSGFHNHSPNITQRGSVADGDVTVGVLASSPDNNIYSYVNWGTSPRIIVAHNPSGMRFKVAYAPATSRGTLSGGTWTKTGPWTIRYTVNHPGISARRFDEFIHMAIKGSVDAESRKITRGMRGKFWRK